MDETPLVGHGLENGFEGGADQVEEGVAAGIEEAGAVAFGAVFLHEVLGLGEVEGLWWSGW